MEYYNYDKARRSLLNTCENGEDFTITIDGVNSQLNAQKDHPSEKIKLSKVGLFTFLSVSQKPWAKVFQHIDIEKYKESDKIIEESKLSGLPVEKRIKYIKNLQKGKGKDINKME